MSFEHPASFEMLAMEFSKKKRIMDDLSAFRQSKDYYAKIGKAWKQGYLLYGPPGMGKSTLVTAMAKYLCYDIYDLDLSAVRNNGQLWKLLALTGSKSVLVVQDINCSLQRDGTRNLAKPKKKKKMKHDLIFTTSSSHDEERGSFIEREREGMSVIYREREREGTVRIILMTCKYTRSIQVI